MKNLGIILRLMKRVAPGLDPKAMGDEIRSRIDEELDYELEAQNQRTIARIYRGHPFIFVPAVVTSLSHERVIVSEFVAGRGFEELKQLPQAERDRLGEIVFRFYFGCMYRHHQFSGDPHPGNSLLLDDGRMAFLDFGLFKRIPPAVAEFELEIARLGDRRRRRGAHRPPARGRLHQGARALHAGRHPRPGPRHDLVVRRRRRGRADARDRDGDHDRDVRPAVVALLEDAPRDAAARPPLRPPPRDADARRHEPAARGRQLAPHRARVDLRRRSRSPSSAARRPSSTPSTRRRRCAAPPEPPALDRMPRGPLARVVAFAIALAVVFAAVLVLVARSPEEIRRGGRRRRRVGADRVRRAVRRADARVLPLPARRGRRRRAVRDASRARCCRSSAAASAR